MPTNDFQVWDPNSVNIENQTAYLADPARLNGVGSGVASSTLANKVWRQASAIASMIGSFINNESGQNAVDDGTTATLLANFTASVASAASGGGVHGSQAFTTSGNFTVPAGITLITYTVTGGGGGSGSSSVNQGSGAGGAGGTARGKLVVTPGQVIVATVGAAGTAGVAGIGGTGGTSTFSTISATGGGGGQPSAASGAFTASGGAGGVGTGGTLNIVGGYGTDGHTTVGGDSIGGEGGASFWGGGSRGAATIPIAAQAYGSGGGGMYVVASNGAAGAGGVIYVEW